MEWGNFTPVDGVVFNERDFCETLDGGQSFTWNKSAESDAETRKILEVFTGDEYTYGRLTLRTQPKKRAGMYFFVMFGWEPDDIALGCKIELSIDSSDTPHPRTFTFTVPETHSVLREIRLGVTGKDWPDSQAVVNAWKIVVKSPSGKVITEKQSWLWGLDAKK